MCIFKAPLHSLFPYNYSPLYGLAGVSQQGTEPESSPPCFCAHAQGLSSSYHSTQQLQCSTSTATDPQQHLSQQTNIRPLLQYKKCFDVLFMCIAQTRFNTQGQRFIYIPNPNKSNNNCDASFYKHHLYIMFDKLLVCFNNSFATIHPFSRPIYPPQGCGVLLLFKKLYINKISKIKSLKNNTIEPPQVYMHCGVLNRSNFLMSNSLTSEIP